MKPRDPPRRTRLSQIIIIFTVLSNFGFGPAVVSKVKQANKLYEKENYDEALKKYTDAQIDKPESPELFFNIADILYKQRKYNDAEQMFSKAISQSDTPLGAKIYYNIGNCKYKQGQLRESLDYYKKALELDPKDEDAKYNIEFVEKKIKEMLSQAKERQEKQEREKEKEKEKQEQEKQKEEQKDSGEQGQKEKTEQETQQMEEGIKGETQQMEEKAGGETKPQEQKPEEKKQGAKPEELNKEEAESLLRMMADEEKNNPRPEDRTRRKPGYYPEVDKPW